MDSNIPPPKCTSNSAPANLNTAQAPRGPSRTANSTPVSSPGLFSPVHPRATMSLPSSHSASEGTTPAAQHSPFLHPLQTHKVRETRVANVDRDFTTGRKIINHYEVIEEIGRGVHGKVKLARDLEDGQYVAIKIVPRYSKRRRLGRISRGTGGPAEKTKREIAILKKIRHPNVVALLEVIDDPDYKKIYLCLEHVECGEVVWRKKGLPHICAFERRRVEREMNGEALTEEEEQYILELERRFNVKEMKRAHLAEKTGTAGDHWSLELGQDDLSQSLGDGTDIAVSSMRSDSPAAQMCVPSSQAPSRSLSMRSVSGAADETLPAVEDTAETSATNTNANESALEGTMYGAYDDSTPFRERSSSVADSIISHMSSLDFNPKTHDPFADDYSYVPCFTIHEARRAFRDVLLGLQYLHYQGIVHRDIKPANLLWTKDHAVKISDFGVSYFGRPMRENGEDETLSESEAQDFDDERELSKTVGTPAFFAPELCFTPEVDMGPPPKVTEKIDIWSLGVTLYCMIFARIPFLAEDEFMMFKKIAEEPVYIPTRRLRPVDPSTSPNTTSLYKRENHAPYRDDHELVYEYVDDNLRDLLDQMLTKDPKRRIDLRSVKQHPWVLQDMPNRIGWIDDTDPSRQSEGRRIQLTDEDLHDAVVPLTLLERARSVGSGVLKKIANPFKLSQNRSADRDDTVRRRGRATSSAASSVGESPAHTPVTPGLLDSRRKSLRGDVDYFATSKENPHSHNDHQHPLTYSVTASPGETPSNNASISRHSTAVGDCPSRQPLEISTDFNGNEEGTDRQKPTPSRLEFSRRRHRHSQSISSATLNLQHSVLESRTAPTTPALDGPQDGYTGQHRKGRDVMTPSDDLARSHSVDRALVFTSQDKRARPKVAISTLQAPGSLEQPKKLQQMRSMDLGKTIGDKTTFASSFFSPHSITSYVQHKSESTLDKFQTVVQAEDRPMTAHRVEKLEGKTPPSRKYGASTPESFARAQETFRRRSRQQYEEQLRQEELQPAAQIDPATVPCPPSPDDDAFINSQAPSREETCSTTFSSNSNFGDAIATPWTSPSVVNSPVSYTTSTSQKELASASTDNMMTFRSDPSLPALLSGASSVSAEPDGDFLAPPLSALNKTSGLETIDSLTPPALSKEPAAGFPLEDAALENADEGSVHVTDHASLTVRGHSTPPLLSSMASYSGDDDDSEDEGILMMGRKSRKAAALKGSPKHVFASKRRNTSASVGSTDTAKKIFPPGE